MDACSHGNEGPGKDVFKVEAYGVFIYSLLLACLVQGFRTAYEDS